MKLNFCLMNLYFLMKLTLDLAHYLFLLQVRDLFRYLQFSKEVPLLAARSPWTLFLDSQMFFSWTCCSCLDFKSIQLLAVYPNLLTLDFSNVKTLNIIFYRLYQIQHLMNLSFAIYLSDYSPDLLQYLSLSNLCCYELGLNLSFEFLWFHLGPKYFWMKNWNLFDSSIFKFVFYSTLLEIKLLDPNWLHFENLVRWHRLSLWLIFLDQVNKGFLRHCFTFLFVFHNLLYRIP